MNLITKIHITQNEDKSNTKIDFTTRYTSMSINLNKEELLELRNKVLDLDQKDPKERPNTSSSIKDLWEWGHNNPKPEKEPYSIIDIYLNNANLVGIRIDKPFEQITRKDLHKAIKKIGLMTYNIIDYVPHKTNITTNPKNKK